MDIELIGLLAVLGLLVLMFLRVPIAVALLITALASTGAACTTRLAVVVAVAAEAPTTFIASTV